MSEKEIKRKLAAVLHADVKGYSRLMGENELATLSTLREYREVLFGLVRPHGGRVVDMAGDGFLVEFPSVVDAVAFAVEFQREIRARNEKVTENRRMEFRIGINVGDVIQDENNIYGDGVNIAARLEGLADPGGICISGTAYDQLKRKLTLDYEYLGEKSVKNIPEPVRAYRVRMEPPSHVVEGPQKWVSSPKWGFFMGLAFLAAVVATVIAAAIWFHWRQAEPEVRESAPPGGVTLAPGPTTTLAVLPFANPTGGPTAECLCEGIPELIIRTLSRIASVSVIARKSSFEFRGTTADIEAVREKLGASHVIQGSLKKRNDAVEIEAGVLDAATGTALWKGRRQGPMAEAVAVPYEISAGVVNALKVPLTADERNRLNDRSAGTTNSSAYVRYLEGLSYAHRNDRETNARARSLFEEAVALDPKYAEAYAALAQTHLLDLRYGWTKFPGLTLGKSMEMTRKALELNDSVTRAHLNMALIHLAKHEHDRAIAEAQKAVALSPNDADALANLGMILVYAGKPDVAVQPVSRAMQLNPAAPNLYCQILGDAYTGMKRYEDAIETYQKGLRSWTVSPALRVRLIAAYSLAGKREEARAAAAELLRTSQRFSLAPLLGRMPFKRAADAARIRDALRDAGVE